MGKSKFDLTANPSLEARKRMAAEDFMIAALPDEAGGLHGVVTFPQIIVAGNSALGLVCAHRHMELEAALTCANEIANALKREASA